MPIGDVLVTDERVKIKAAWEQLFSESESFTMSDEIDEFQSWVYGGG